jgi:hypothetical protein
LKILCLAPQPGEKIFHFFPTLAGHFFCLSAVDFGGEFVTEAFDQSDGLRQSFSPIVDADNGI